MFGCVASLIITLTNFRAFLFIKEPLDNAQHICDLTANMGMYDILGEDIVTKVAPPASSEYFLCGEVNLS